MKKIEAEDIIQKNEEYLKLAEQYGCFQDGYDKNDRFTSSSDGILVHWIDEIGSLKEDKEKFVNEILPTFKRWVANDLEWTVGVGFYYDLLKLAERHGIKVTNGSFNCLVSMMLEKNLTFSNQYNNHQELTAHFQIKEIMNNLARMHKNGIPLILPLASCYDCLLSAEEQNGLLDFDTFIFFYTINNLKFSKKMGLYEDKKMYEEQYGYFTCNADEVNRLNSWLRYFGGYNIQYESELKKKIEKLQEKINRSKNFSEVKEKFLKANGTRVTVSYYTLDESEKSELHKINGYLVNCQDNSLKIRKVKDETEVIIEDNETSILSKVLAHDKILPMYECKTIEERAKIYRIKQKLNEVKSYDVASAYIEKYGTIEGLAYLKTGGLAFISLVKKDQFPLNNLFTYCFEVIYSTFYASRIEPKEEKECLEYTLAAYNKLMSGEIESLKDCNYGYPINNFLSEDVLEIAQRVCLYIVTSDIKAQLPDEMPGEPKKPEICEEEIVLDDQLDNQEELENPKEEIVALERVMKI